MFDAHQLIARYGVAGARDRAANKTQRVCLDAAAAMIARREETPQVIHGGLAVVCPPRRRLIRAGQEATVWANDLHVASFRLEAGPDALGVPFGSAARMIMLWIHHQAITGNSRAIDVSPSMHAWLRQLGFEVGGMTYRAVREQMRRVAKANIAVSRGGVTVLDAPIIDSLVFEHGEVEPLSREYELLDVHQMSAQTVLSKAFFDYIVAHPAALDLGAIKLVRNNCWAMDLYIALAYELPRLKGPSFISWADFTGNFGVNNKYSHHFKASFLSALPLVCAIYNSAKVEAGPDGVTFHPSPPPV